MYWKYVVRRILYAALIMVVCVFIFSALFNTVADKVMRGQIDEQVKGEIVQIQKSNRGMHPEQLQAIRDQRTAQLYAQYHLNEPMMQRIMYRTLSSLVFNFGTSTQMKSLAGSNNVNTIIYERIPRTLLLFGVAAVLDIILGVWLGLVKARRAGKMMDRSTDLVTMVLFGLPLWWLGMMFIMLFAFAIPIFPSSAMHASPPPADALGNFLDLMHHLALPVITIVLFGFWGRAYITRNLVVSTLQEDFIMSARARGLSERRILFGHTLRSAAPPIVTMSLLALVVSIGGGLVFEGIFSWPGLGNLYWQAVQQNDVPVLMADLMVTTVLFIACLAFLDLIYGFLDPRVKVGGKA